jgi:Tol biopolymer transport system component
MRRMIARLLFGVLLALAASGLGTEARAAFPGSNGKIAFVSFRDGNQEIYAMNPNGTGQTNLTNNQADDRQPVWSVDGTKIAFQSDRTGTLNIFTMKADGTDVLRVTNDPSPYAFNANPTWSPDGTKIAYQRQEFGFPDVYVANADGSGDITNLTNTQTSPSQAPHGRRTERKSPSSEVRPASSFHKSTL